MDIQTLDKSSQWRSDDEVKTSLIELVEKKLKSKYPKEVLVAYECYLSYISQVKITHQKVIKWEIGQAICQYHGFMEGCNRVLNFSRGDIKAKIIEIIDLFPPSSTSN